MKIGRGCALFGRCRMCLGVLNDEFDATGEGYKIMEKRNGELFFKFKGTSHPVPVGVWIKEGNFRNYPDLYKKYLYTTFSKEPYKYGFHIHTNKVGYNEIVNVMVKVQYRDAVAEGYQPGWVAPIIVAKEMKILEEVV